MSEVKKKADEYIESTYESELPPDCISSNPEITSALIRYLRLIYIDAYKQAQKDIKEQAENG